MAGISINIGGNFTKLDELKDKAQKTANSIKGAFNSNVGKAMFAGVAAASAAAFAGVVAAMKSAIDAGGELNDMMARTGAAGKGLVIMQRAFENAGMAASQVPQALNRMQKALAGVNEEGEPTNAAFEKLGLSVGELASMDTAEAFKRIADAISSIQNPAQRAAVAMEIFGKAGGEMLAVLNDPKAFSGAAEQVGGLGDTLANNAAALDAVGDAFGALDVKVRQLGVEVAVALLPQLQALAEWLNETDFSAVGQGIGILAEKIVTLGEKLAELAKYAPMMIVFQKIADLTIGGELSPDEKAKAKEKAAEMADPNYVRSTDRPQESGPGMDPSLYSPKKTSKKAGKPEDQGHSLADAMEKGKAAAAKKAEAVEEYNLDAQILSARLKGGAQRLAALEREKKIREEMHRLESAGFTKDQARRPAEAKVDAEKKASDKEGLRHAEAVHKQKLQEDLADKVNDTRKKQEHLEYKSSVGSISAMQRIGGGGGAVGSGLDYARQAADLQREANNYLRQLIEVSRRDVEI